MAEVVLRSEVKSQAVRDLLSRRFPRLMNQELNKSFKFSTSKYAKEVSRGQLSTKGIFKVKRRGSFKSKSKGGPSLPVKMRKAGFVSELTGRNNLRQRKHARIHTGNPLIVIRERGGAIKPKKAGGFLFIHGEFKGRGAKAKREALFKKRNPRGNRSFTRSGSPITAKVRSIYQRPIFGFEAGWRRRKRRVLTEQRRASREVVRRVNLKKARKAS